MILTAQSSLECRIITFLKLNSLQGNSTCPCKMSRLITLKVTNQKKRSEGIQALARKLIEHQACATILKTKKKSCRIWPTINSLWPKAMDMVGMGRVSEACASMSWRVKSMTYIIMEGRSRRRICQIMTNLLEILFNSLKREVITKTLNFWTTRLKMDMNAE